MTDPALLVALHGSPHPAAGEFATALSAALAAALPGVAVRTAWVDSRVATMAETLAAGPAVVVPGFLTAGYHVQVDVPDAVAGTTAQVTGHVGPFLAGALADRIREAGGPGDAILLAAAGSNRAEARREVEAAADRLGRTFGVPVRVGYLYGPGEPVEDAAAALASSGHQDVTTSVFFLSDGLYTARLGRLRVARTTAPIGVHDGLVAAIVRLYTGALAPAAPAYLAGLHLAGRRVLVAGAGAVASRRLPALLEAGADLHVVAPEASALVRSLADDGRLTWTPRRVVAADADDAWYVLAATDDPAANALVSAAAEARHTFCVRADEAAAGSARTPASGTARAAAVAVGVVSAGGRDPRRMAAARDVAVAAVDAWASAQEQSPKGAA